MTTCVIIPGKPQAKARPRATVRGGHAVVYNPKSNEIAEARIKSLAGPFFHKPFQGAVVVVINAYFRPAKSWSKKKRAAALGGPHTQKPDFDNVGKLCCDALNGTAYIDDAQIASAVVNKWWSETERVEIEVTPFSAIMCRSPEVAELPVHRAINGDDKPKGVNITLVTG